MHVSIPSLPKRDIIAPKSADVKEAIGYVRSLLEQSRRVTVLTGGCRVAPFATDVQALASRSTAGFLLTAE